MKFVSLKQTGEEIHSPIILEDQSPCQAMLASIRLASCNPAVLSRLQNDEAAQMRRPILF